MITPDTIARALAGDEEALALLRGAVEQAAHAAIETALKRVGPDPHIDPGQATEDLLRQTFAKLWDDDGSCLRAWNPSVTTFGEHVRPIAEHIALVGLAARGHTRAAMELEKALDVAARPAIGALLRKYGIYRRRDANADMDELLGEVFEKLWKNDQAGFRAWKPAVASFDVYIGTIAKRHGIDKYRRRHEILPDTDDLIDQQSESDNPENWLEVKDYHAKVLDNMRAKLTTKQQREMFHLLIELGLTVDEIRERNGMSPAAVYQWREFFKNLAEKVRKELDSDPDPPSRNKPRRQK